MNRYSKRPTLIVNCSQMHEKVLKDKHTSLFLKENRQQRKADFKTLTPVVLDDVPGSVELVVL
jgi:hypothetical protein